MKIIGIGTDIVEVGRIDSMIARHGDRFLNRVFVPEEREYCDRIREPSRNYAVRFAAKEAVSKALGTGITKEVGWLDIVIERAAVGKPSVRLEGAGAAFAQSIGVTSVLITLSHADHYAVAYAVAIGEP